MDYLVDVTEKFRRYIKQNGKDTNESVVNSSIKKMINFGGYCPVCEDSLCVRIPEEVMSEWLEKTWCENPIQVQDIGSIPRSIGSYIEKELKREEDRKRRGGFVFGERGSVLDYRPKGVIVHEDQKKLDFFDKKPQVS